MEKTEKLSHIYTLVAMRGQCSVRKRGKTCKAVRAGKN